MKKFIALVMAIALCCMSASCAFAASAGTLDGNGAFWFDKRIGCTSTDASTMVPVHPTGNTNTKRTNDQRINVYFNCYDGNNTLTNYFIPFRRTTGANCGSKWVTPGLEIPIRSDNIRVANSYNVKARGNTDHALAQYGGNTSVGIFGYYKTK